MTDADPIRIFVGTDRSQLLAVKVLEHSIKRHTTARVEVTPMLDLPIAKPADPRNWQRTGFSFSRFAIPKLAGYRGHAIYMDADMLVVRDIRELWTIPFNGGKIVIQEELSADEASTGKDGSPKKRIKQCAVMLLDCDALDWDADRIVAGLNAGDYDYERLMYDFCILDEGEIRYDVPFQWNSLEHFDATTGLIHYTDMMTQPWVYSGNRNAEVWFAEVRLMLRQGALTWAEIREEIRLGHFRPSLIGDLKWRHRVPAALQPLWDKKNLLLDRLRGYVPHRAVYQQKREQKVAAKRYATGLQTQS